MFFVREKPPHTPHKQANRGNLTYHSPPYGGGAGGGATVHSLLLCYLVSPTLLPCLLLPTVLLSLTYPV